MKPASDDTIAAIATAAGGGIGIVRISGPRAEAIARALVPSLPAKLTSHKLHLGEARAPGDGTALDEVMTVLMRGPRSYTGEDVAELHGHGGPANLQRLLHAALGAGARLATPGEFSRRAFLAGKIDLSQAEAIAAVIGARDERALLAAQTLRSGRLGRAVDEARRAIVIELAEIEGALDFPDEADADRADRGAADEATRVERLRAIARSFRAAASGFRGAPELIPEVFLVGQVNAGKSSLLNALLGQERALVDEGEGTTRDLVEAELKDERAGLLRLIDTAGLRTESSALERRGQALAEERRRSAALSLLVFDGGRGWSAGDEALRAALSAEPAPLLIVENKADLPARGGSPAEAIRVSARTGLGLAELRTAVADALGRSGVEELPLASARQAEALGRAAQSIDEGLAALAGAPEVAAVELRHALHALGQVTGETADEQVLDAIFARFCIGK